MSPGETESLRQRMRSHQRTSEKLLMLSCLLGFVSLLFAIFLFSTQDFPPARFSPESLWQRYSLISLAFATFVPFALLVWRQLRPTKGRSNSRISDSLSAVRLEIAKGITLIVVLLSSLMLGSGLIFLVLSGPKVSNSTPDPPTPDQIPESVMVDLIEEHTRFIEGVSENMEVFEPVLTSGAQAQLIEATTAKARVQPKWSLTGMIMALIVLVALVWVVVFWGLKWDKRPATSIAAALTFTGAALVGSISIFDITVDVPERLSIQTAKPPIKIENLLSLQGSSDFHLSYRGVSLESNRVDFEDFTNLEAFDSGESELPDEALKGTLAEVEAFIDSHEQTVVFVMGSADRQPLSTDTEAIHQTNLGLARDRAKFVREKLLNHLDSDDRPPPTIMAFPVVQSALAEDSTNDELGQDRKVSIYALGAGLIEKAEATQDENEQGTPEP